MGGNYTQDLDNDTVNHVFLFYQHKSTQAVPLLGMMELCRRHLYLHFSLGTTVLLFDLIYCLSKVRTAARVSILSLLVAYSALSHGETEAEYQQRLQALSASIEALQKELRSTKNDKDKLQASLRKSEEKQATLAKRIVRIKEALDREKKRLAQLQRQRVELENAKTQQQSGINDSIRQAYKMGQSSALQLLLNQEDPATTHRLTRYHRYIIAERQQVISDYNATLDKLRTIETDINESTQTLTEQQQALQQQQQALRSTQKNRLAVIKKMRRSLTSQEQQLTSLTADQQRLQTLLDEATSALANITLPENTRPFADLRGKLPFPTQGNISQHYGRPQFGGKLKRNGILVGNTMGADVVSVHYGRVIFADYLRGHGLLLIVDHGDGYMSLYGHNETLLKAVGEWVGAGEKIATVGNSGGQTQVGLYFEIRHKGAPINPQPWLAKR